jgi:lysophospholipase L1-like esterase
MANSDTETPPVGMVDSLDGQGGGPTADALEFARAYMVEGDMDPAVIARILDPQAVAERERAKAALRERDWPALSHYRDANAALAGQETRAVFMGDSITEMWGIAQPDLFTDGRVNRGVSGQTSPQMLVRFMADVVALKPRAVHLMCGTNDIAGNTGPTTPRDYRNAVTAMVDLAQANGIAVILAGVPPLNGLPWAPDVAAPQARVAELNAWLKAFAADRRLVHADYGAVLSDGADGLRPTFTRDGVHPGPRGYAAMRPVAEAALAAALRSGG